MIGVIAGIVLYCWALWKLIDWYDNAYRKPWYWKYRERKAKILRKINREPKDEILGYNR